MRFLTAADVLALVPMPDAIAAVRQACIELSAGRVAVPQRARVPVGEAGVLLAMPGYLPAAGGLGAMLVTVFPRNPQQGLPTVFALVVLADPHTGEPAALIEGTSLTALRTGAAGGLAADLLARRDAAIVALFGAGVQGRTQLEALCAVRRITQVRVVDRRPEHAEAFAAWARAQPWLGGATVIPVRDPALAVRGAEVIVTATTSATPVFPAAEVGPGVHITAVGAFSPDAREVPGEVLARAAIVVDSREAALAEAGDLIIPIREGLLGPEAIRAEIGEVAAGTAPGRTHPEEVTVFKSVGHAVQDLAVAALALARAEAAGRGTVLEVEELPGGHRVKNEFPAAIHSRDTTPGAGCQGR
ncbi:MAG: ornithine cyclodeaminase family protein [Armatimonadota bacterium]|nr:ornithine cyclodeaminase family protein [Armatimonadota bacterium]MDR7519850.1 ornithine cyclodeaminase family protein [Armatimonadota bacterium]MDR7551073.1 ornithine cyclodeaminase family protein [Armatimonadota bacterium]